jgi:hypothetical protein
MSKKNIALVALLIVLGAFYVVFFTNLFRDPKIEITSRLRPQFNSRRSRNAPAAAGTSISFLLNNKYELTSVKVVEENDAKTNKYPHALWHLISDSNSVPTKSIFYGATVQGMKPEFAKVKPEPLEPNVSYLLSIEAGNLKGQTSFKVR